MSFFVVENGDGLAEATSYVNVSFADGYLGDAWAPQDKKERALVAASEYVDIRWGQTLAGTKKNTMQGLQFPRAEINFDGVIPLALKKAVCIYAKNSVAETLYPSQDKLNNPIKSISKGIGPLSKSITYADAKTNDIASQWLKIPLADALIEPFLNVEKTKAKPSRVIRM